MSFMMLCVSMYIGDTHSKTKLCVPSYYTIRSNTSRHCILVKVLDRYISTPIYIGRYDDVANVSYRQNSANRYR